MDILHPLLPVPLYAALIAGLTAIVAIAMTGDPDTMLQMISISGGMSIWMLMLCVATGPVAWLVQAYPALRILVGRARVNMAVFTLLSSAVHVALYMHRKGELQILVDDAMRLPYLLAWIGSLVLICSCLAVLLSALRKRSSISIWLDASLGLTFLPLLAHWLLVEGQGVLAITLQVLPLAGLELLRLAQSFRTS